MDTNNTEFSVSECLLCGQDPIMTNLRRGKEPYFGIWRFECPSPLCLNFFESQEEMIINKAAELWNMANKENYEIATRMYRNRPSPSHT